MSAKVSSSDLVKAYRRRAQRSAKPVLVVAAGLPASGKSHFADMLVRREGFVRVSSDDVRMALSGGKPNYTGPEHAATFGTVGRIVGALLDEGARVVVDSTSLVARERRGHVALGREAKVPVAIVWCEVDEATAAKRLERRASDPAEYDASQADAAIRARMAPRANRPTDAEADLVVVLTPENGVGTYQKLIRFID